MEQKHDSSYHQLFSEPHLFEDMIRNFVDEPWVADLDFANMERINAKFHTENLVRREGDIIMRIPLKQQQEDIYLLLLLEFQSSIDRWMPVRLGAYVHLLYQQLIKEKRLTKHRKLPPVFPLVLYNGHRRWKVATELKVLINLPDNTPLWQYQPAMRYYLIDEGRYPDGKQNSLSGLIFKLENIHSPSVLKDILADCAKLAQGPQYSSFRRFLIIWVTHVLAPRKGIEIEPQDTDCLEEVGNMLEKRLDQWEKNVFASGLLEGMEKGIEKGKEEGIVIVARRLIAAGHDDSFIAEVTGLSIEYIQKLRQEMDGSHH